jgi:hypothetical protein
MDDDRVSGDAAVVSVSRAAEAWTARGDVRPLARWLGRELGPDGVLRRRPVPEWWPCLEEVRAARERRPEGWPLAIDALLEPVVRSALRFTRPDGSAVFGPDGATKARRTGIVSWAGLLSDPGLETVARWWFPARGRTRGRPAPPPLPAFAVEGMPLAMLRPDWSRRGDFLAIDQRAASPGAIELAGGGRRWLGPSWPTPPGRGPCRVVRWMTGPQADLLEWSLRTEAGRLTRTAVLLRGRGLALLAELWDLAGDPTTLDVELAPGVLAQSVPESRSLRLRGPRGGSLQVVPLGLPPSDYPTDRGSLTGTDGRIRLSQPRPTRRTWVPLLFSWDPARVRRPVSWRVLTVTERTKPCRPGAAFAARVGWGHGEEGLVVYRSLGRPALRCFLGHPTTARFLIGAFTTEGEVVPLVKVEA